MAKQVVKQVHEHITRDDIVDALQSRSHEKLKALSQKALSCEVCKTIWTEVIIFKKPLIDVLRP